MRYWITTHSPHADPRLPWFIYLRRPRADLPEIGDAILFYETLAPEPDQRRRGRGAVVFAASVSGEAKRNTHGRHEEWGRVIECHRHRALRVPLARVRSVIAGPFYRSTLTQISESQYRAIAGR